MIHVISAMLARLARRIDTIRDGRISEAAAWYGWTTVQVARSTWEYRDPRFTELRMDRMGLRTGCDHCDEKVQAAIDNRVLEGIGSPMVPSWTQAAITDRIRRLGDAPVWGPSSVPGVFVATGRVSDRMPGRADSGRQ